MSSSCTAKNKGYSTEKKRDREEKNVPSNSYQMSLSKALNLHLLL